MVVALCFLFILVMTHALVALPVSGSGYYSHKFLKYRKERPAFETVPKAVFAFPKINPVIFHEKIIPEVPKKGFSFGYPLWKNPHMSTFWLSSSPPDPVIDTTSSESKLFYDNMLKGKSQFETPASSVEPYSLFKSSYFSFPSITREPVTKYLKNYNRIPKIFEISFAKSKPKILLVKGTSSPFYKQNEWNPTDVGSSHQIQPKPNSDKNIVAIDIIKTGAESPTKYDKPDNDIDYFSVVSVPFDHIGVKDIPTDKIDISIADISKPNSGDEVIVDIPGKGSANTKITDTPTENVNTVFDASPMDINIKKPNVKINQDLTIVPIMSPNGVGAPAEKLETGAAIIVGDIPGFIVDGGNSLDKGSDPVYVTNEIPRSEKGFGIFNINDVSANGPTNANIFATNTGFGQNSNEIFPSTSFGGNDITLSSEVSNEGIIESPDMVNIDVQSEFVVGGNKGNNTLLENMLIGVQNGQNNVDNFVTPVQQVAESRLSDINLSNKMSLGGSIGSNSLVPVNTKVGGVSIPEEDTKSQRTGSVVIIRPISFLMKVEPFGPGPYGQCRAPARVVCGARFGWEHVTGMTEWCQSNCVVFMYSSYCDDNHCQCKCV